MPAAIDTTNGQSSFVSAHEDAWHTLGTTLDHTFTATVRLPNSAGEKMPVCTLFQFSW